MNSSGRLSLNNRILSVVTISTNQYIFKVHDIDLFSQSVGHGIFRIYHLPGHLVSGRDILL